MWQPSKTQWRIIWIVAIVMILAWPPDRGRSLALKATNWLVDPSNSLPEMPDPLPMGVDDDGDTVADHDAQEAAYYRAFDSSRMTRLRMTLKTAADPLDPSTEHQILTGVAILSALVVWRLEKKLASRQ